MRRLCSALVGVALLAGCSSGAGNVGSAPTSAGGSSGEGAKFCAAYSSIKNMKVDTTPAAAGAALRSAAADMRASAPSAIKSATESYAALVDSIGKAAAQSAAKDQLDLQKELAKGITKAQDIASVAVWVSQNCHT